MLADEPAQRRVGEALAFDARRLTAVAEPGALLAQIWERCPDVIIIAGAAQAAHAPALCRQVRQFFQTPILVADEGAREEARIGWLDSGADDALDLAEAAPAELRARCFALLRRLQRQRRRDPAALDLRAHGMRLDLAGRRLHLADGQALDLTVSQLRLLALFFKSGGDMLPTAQIAAHLLGGAAPAELRRAAALVQSLNRRLASLKEPLPRLENVRGRGYRLTIEGDAAKGPA
ncbi:MAG TPA: winged helix-turn-helix domain-containing protein [Chloroflexaceae bacterium]|nr:winged helix-turn-helix domain-containing protein [Chloroflexaceae bacterium]